MKKGAIVTIARPKRPSKEAGPKPVIKHAIVTIKSEKTKKAEAKWRRLTGRED